MVILVTLVVIILTVMVMWVLVITYSLYLPGHTKESHNFENIELDIKAS